MHLPLETINCRRESAERCCLGVGGSRWNGQRRWGGGALAEVTGAVVAVELGVVDGPDMGSDTRLSGPDLRRK